MPRNALMCWICGIVASPTPTVPISADSISRISRRGPNARAKSAAAIQPAVPPPTITTRRIAASFMPEDCALDPCLGIMPSTFARLVQFSHLDTAGAKKPGRGSERIKSDEEQMPYQLLSVLIRVQCFLSRQNLYDTPTS